MKRNMTKRQLLNELLVIEDKNEALAASQDRLWDKKARLVKSHKKIAAELEKICLAEAKKKNIDEDFDEPILFKNHIFTIEPGGYSSTTTVSIQSTKNVK